MKMKTDVYCKGCDHYRTYPGEIIFDKCTAIKYERKTYDGLKPYYKMCAEVNKNNDCEMFEPEKSDFVHLKEIIRGLWRTEK